MVHRGEPPFVDLDALVKPTRRRMTSVHAKRLAEAAGPRPFAASADALALVQFRPLKGRCLFTESIIVEPQPEESERGSVHLDHR
jgi:hypothetical protein